MSSQEYFCTIFGFLHGHQLVIYIFGNPLEEVPFYIQQLDIDKYLNSQTICQFSDSLSIAQVRLLLIPEEFILISF